MIIGNYDKIDPVAALRSSVQAVHVTNTCQHMQITQIKPLFNSLSIWFIMFHLRLVAGDFRKKKLKNIVEKFDTKEAACLGPL